MNGLRKTGTGLIILGLSACSHHMPAPVDDIQYSSAQSPKNYSFSNTPAAELKRFHNVHPGETLFAIAWKYSLDYHEVARINKLKSFRIYPGQKLTLRQELPKSIFEPSTLVAAINSDVLNKKQSISHPRKITARKNTQTQKTSTPNQYKKRAKNRVKQSRVANNRIKNWIWPVNGKILEGFSNKNNQNKGLDIKAKLGAPVRATAPGKVVYSGNGLRGYGQLVIIKHNDSYLSAYAHNNKIHVTENEVVKAGQRIADIGKSGADKTKLHFEIRYKGKPVNPLNYLPKAG